ncbi:MAG: hypothetical protein ACFLMY_00195 [Candidatus Brachytrichaceae bacterium NZ_4S206]|jgi:hypothetical protein
MTTRTEEVIVKATNGQHSKSAAAAAAEAVERYGPADAAAQAEAIAQAWKEKLIQQTRALNKRVAQAAAGNGAAPEAGAPIGPGLYNWFDVLVAGPFQAVAALGPFRPHKIIAANEAAFLLVAIWRNPLPIPPGGPSAAQVMTGLSYHVNLETMNLTTVSDGPDFMQSGMFGGGFVDVHVFNFPAGTFGLPASGKPSLFEIIATVDVVAPGGAPLPVGLPPFAAFSTWQFDPDIEPPIPPFTPGVAPQLQHDIPTRIMVFR